MNIKYIVNALALFVLGSTAALADPVCSNGMLRGRYAFQGDGQKTVSSTVKNAVIQGIINVKSNTGVEIWTTDTVYGSSTSTTLRRVGTLQVGKTLAFSKVRSEAQLNCRGEITLDATTLGGTAYPEVKIRLVIFDGGNGFYMYNAATNELWTATAQKI